MYGNEIPLDIRLCLVPRLGKLVAYLILGSYKRGKKRTGRIVTHRIGNSPWPRLRFDIEDTM